MEEQILMEIQLYLELKQKDCYSLEVTTDPLNTYKLKNLRTNNIEFLGNNIEGLEKYIKKVVDYFEGLANWNLRKFLRLYLASHNIEYDSFTRKEIRITYYEDGRRVIKDFPRLYQLLAYCKKHFNFSLNFINEYICPECGKWYEDIEIKDNCIKYLCDCGNEVISLL